MNPITKETMTNLRNTVKRRGIIVFRKYSAADYQCGILELLPWNSPQTQFGLKYGPFLKHCHRRLIHRFPLVYLCKQHFGVLTVKFLLNQITTEKMASLENIVTSLRIIILCNSYSAYHQNDAVELLPWNCQLTLLWRKRYPICKILSHASKLSFSFTYLVLIV